MGTRVRRASRSLSLSATGNPCWSLFCNEKTYWCYSGTPKKCSIYLSPSNNAVEVTLHTSTLHLQFIHLFHLFLISNHLLDFPAWTNVFQRLRMESNALSVYLSIIHSSVHLSVVSIILQNFFYRGLTCLPVSHPFISLDLACSNTCVFCLQCSGSSRRQRWSRATSRGCTYQRKRVQSAEDFSGLIGRFPLVSSFFWSVSVPDSSS